MAPVDEELEIEQKEGDNIDLDDMIGGGDNEENRNEQEGEIVPRRPATRERRMTFMGSFLRKPSYFGS